MRNLVILILCLLALSSCERDLLRRARIAHTQRDTDSTAQLLDQILAKDPDHFEAKRLYADVHIFRREYDIAEKNLNDLWAEHDFAKEKDFVLEERISKRLLEEQYKTLYGTWVKEVDPKKDPEIYEKIALKGLKQNPENTQLTQDLVRFYFSTGDSLVDGNKKSAAAMVFTKILKLKTVLPQQRDDAKKRVEKLKMDVFREKAIHRFESSMLPLLREEGRWEPAKRLIRFQVKGLIDRKLNLRKENDLDAAKERAHDALRVKISESVVRFAGKEGRVAKHALPKYRVVSESYKSRKFEIFAEVTFDAMLNAGFMFAISEK